ncbi:MAG: CHAT domain-containing protein [Bacteroidetes bacterium]|nr:CHAT domain-containing protein [Bacteroidota bacterium]
MRRIIFLAFLIPAFSFAQKSGGDKLYQQAKDALDAGDKKKATKALTSARSEYLKEKNYYWYFVCSQSLYLALEDEGQAQEAHQMIKETMGAIPMMNDPKILDTHAKLNDNLAYIYLYDLNQPEEAIKSYTEAIRLYERGGKANSQDAAMEYTNRATTYYTLMKYPEAATDFKQGLSLYEKDTETTPDLLAGNLRSLGLCYYEMNSFEDAVITFRKGLSLLEKSDNSELKGTLLNDIGNVFNKESKNNDAIAVFEKAMALNESRFGKDADHYALNLINIGNAYKDMGDYDRALTDYQAAIDIFSKTPPTDDMHLTDLLLNLCRLTDDMGMAEESQKLLDQANDYIKTKYGENSLEQADVYISMAVTAYNHGESDESLNYNFKALSIMEAHQYPISSTHAQIYNNVGQAYDDLHDPVLALQYKQKALDLYRQIYGPSHPSVAMATGNIGLSYEIEGDYDRAIEYLKKDLELRLTIQDPNHEDIGSTYINIGLMYLKKNDGKNGVAYLEKARNIFDPYNKHIMKAMVYNRLAAGYQLLGNRNMEKNCLQQAFIANVMNFSNTDFNVDPQQPDYINYYEMILTYTSKADFFVRLGDKTSLVKAGDELDAADQILSAKALTLKSAQDRLFLAQTNSFFTEAGMKLMDKLYQQTHDQQYLRRAFYFSERSKANELYADIRMTKAISVSGIPRKLLDRRAGLQTRLSTLRQQLSAAYDAGNQPLITRLKAQEFDLTKQLASAESEIGAASPNRQWMTRASLPSWDNVAQLLNEETAVVMYTMNDSAKYILVGTKNKLALRQIPSRTDIDKLVRGFTNQVKFQSPGLKTVADQLTEILWSPVESAFAELAVHPTQVIIVPDGALNFLPFEALGKNHYLLEQYTIHYQLSCALMLNRAVQTVRGKPSFVALAPVFEDKETSFINKSCQRFIEKAQKSDSTTRAFSLNGEYITPLPATEDEVEQINKIHTDKGIFSRYFTRETAREDLIKKGELADFDYIHFATHGFVNSQYPDLSGLLLAQEKDSSEDGILYSGEIAALTLRADLVTLSACETALGKKIEGEGVRGLTTAFMMAGARSVIASLWKVADESTAQLMIAFYTELLSGKDKASALKDAKKKLLSDSKYSHPYYWAPFIQIGSNSTK